MICDKCMDSFYAQAISKGVCEECNDIVYSPHIPCYKLCPECSEKLNKCKQCGELIDNDI
jgi:hypothetical protein